MERGENLMFWFFNRKRTWEQKLAKVNEHQAEIDRLTESMFKNNVELCKEYRKQLDRYSDN